MIGLSEDVLRSVPVLRAVSERSADGVILIGRDRAIFYRSTAVAQLLGGSDDGPGERPWLDNVYPEDRADFVASLERLFSGEAEVPLGFRIVHRDGTTRWMEGAATNLLAHPEVEAIVASFRDVTSRKLSQLALQESEARYRQLIEELPEPILVHVDGKIAYANDACAELAGLEGPKDLVGRSILEFASPDTVAPLTARMAGATGRRLEPARQSFVRPRDGREVHVEVHSTAIDFGGRPAMLSVARDITERRESERRMAAVLEDADLERRKLSAVLAALPAGVWIADASGLLTTTNPAAARIWGGSAPKVATTAAYGVYRGRWPATGRQLGAEEWALARVLRTGEIVVAESIDIDRFDGSVGHVVNSAGPILDETGATVGGVACMLDVTVAYDAMREREALRTSLEFEQRRFGRLLEHAPAMIVVLRGRDHVIEYVNGAFRAASGLRNLVGEPLLMAMPELRGQPFTTLLDEVFAHGQAGAGEAGSLSLGGGTGVEAKEYYVNFVCQPMLEVDGTTSGVFAHLVDVTAAAVAQRRLRAQFNGVPVPTYVWQRRSYGSTRQFLLVDYNDAALTASAGKVAAHLGDPATLFFLDIPGAADHLHRCLDEGTTIQEELDRTASAAGEVLRFCMTYAPVAPDLVIVHAEDITERTKLEAQLRHGQKMEAVGRLAGGVAHDFNNLLLVILGYSSMALEDETLGSELREDLMGIHHAGERAAQLTAQLLAFSRRQVLQPQVIDVDATLDGMQSLLGRLLGEDIEVALHKTVGLGRVLADPSQIEQVVMNLAVNARDAMPEGGRLTIETANVVLDDEYASTHPTVTPGPHVLIAVSDTGTGMSSSTLSRAFEPFFTTKDQGRGTGLGLATVFGIVQQSGGHVAVYSELGHGAVFKVYLPRVDPLVEHPPMAATDAARGGSETILLVEDSDQVRAVARAMLTKHGYHVLEASDGDAALVVANDFVARIDLLMTDVIMPRMNGRKLAEKLSAARPDMKVLFVSGYTDDAIVHHGVLDVSVAFLQKPFVPDALLRKVRSVLDAEP